MFTWFSSSPEVRDYFIINYFTLTLFLCVKFTGKQYANNRSIQVGSWILVLNHNKMWVYLYLSN